MKKTFLFICMAALLISCKKNSGAPNPALLEHYPQSWIFTNDASTDKYTYLKMDGNNVVRHEILKSYSLTQLALDDHCKFYLNLSRTEFTNEICVTIQVDLERKRWLFAGFSSNKQEVHLRSSTSNSETEDPGGDGYRFFIHDLPKANGVKTVAIESVDHPGYYISTSSPGFNYSQTLAVLEKASDPTKATPWQCR